MSDIHQIINQNQSGYIGDMQRDLRALPKTILHAVQFAADKHANQRRKNVQQMPYINHCIDVATLLANHGETEVDVLVAALLHDTVEDTKTTLREIEDSFGLMVAEMVGEVTDDKSLSAEERKRLQVQHAPDLSCGAQLVKIADKICNVREMGDGAPAGWSLVRRRQYVEWAILVVGGLTDVSDSLRDEFNSVALAQLDKLV